MRELSRERRVIFWDAAISLGGILLVALTFRAYQYFRPLQLHGAALLPVAPAEADARISAAKSAVADNPEDIKGWSDLAIGYYQKGPDGYVDGLNALEKAETLGSTDETLFYYAGVMYDALGLPDYAINEFRKFLRYFPDHYESLVRLANVYFRMGRYDEADQLYRQVLKQWPKDPTVWFNFAVVAVKKGKLDEARAALERVHSLAGQLPAGGYFQEGEIARLKGNEDAALSLYAQEYQRNPSDLPSLEAAEAIERHRKNYKEAKVLHKRITDLKHSQSNG